MTTYLFVLIVFISFPLLVGEIFHLSGSSRPSQLEIDLAYAKAMQAISPENLRDLRMNAHDNNCKLFLSGKKCSHEFSLK